MDRGRNYYIAVAIQIRNITYNFKKRYILLDISSPMDNTHNQINIISID
jgi:hypothetical protein